MKDDTIHKGIRICIWAVIVLFLAVVTVVYWPRWWKGFNYEHSPIAYLQTLILFLCFLAGMALAVLSPHREKSLLLTLQSGGFLFLTLDELFCIHEYLKDRFFPASFQPSSLLAQSGWGDFILLFVFIAALFVFPWILKIYESHKIARHRFILAFILAGVAVSLDAFKFPPDMLLYIRWHQFTEEIIETVSLTFFLIAQVCLFPVFKKTTSLAQS